ncbi:hypothetical protein ACH5RR_037602 [Cinchona calisaya]|uniref:Uncharacterized protein n=1 Tax=Cinchona calisaya TaxID=153742 RepID=A0ABD2Y7Z3_9GENT
MSHQLIFQLSINLSSLVSTFYIYIYMGFGLYTGARVSPGFASVQKPGGSPQLTWREFGFDEARLEYYRRRKILDAETMRMAPGGPDPQHHSKPPALS